MTVLPNRILKFVATIFLCVLSWEIGHAQFIDKNAGADSIRTALIPALGYKSDVGFVGGGLYNRINYKGKAKPFNYYIKSSALISTKGMFSLEAEYEKTHNFNTNIRSDISLLVYRYIHDYYFGIGNSTTFDKQQFDNEYYFYRSMNFNLSYEWRLPLFQDDGSQFDFLWGLQSTYETSSINKVNSLYNQNRPNGFEGGWVNDLSTGFIWENRNSEFDPTSGNYFEIKLRAAPKFLFNDFGLVTLHTDLREYFRLFNWVTVANRLQVHHSSGDIPYWELASLGSDETLRGYPLNRFMGTSSISYNLELRKWILSFPEYSLKFGGHLFTDIGRVFTSADDIKDLFSGYKQTFGIGGTMSVVSPEFILRGEMGFSKDMMRIYIGIGYTF